MNDLPKGWEKAESDYNKNYDPFHIEPCWNCGEEDMNEDGVCNDCGWKND